MTPIAKAILGAVGVGMLWASVGVVFSRVTRKGADCAPFMALSAFIVVAGGLIIFPDYSAMKGNVTENLFSIQSILVAAGICSSAGMFLMHKAMRMGHHGATWTIGQSGFVIPFLTGILLWHDSADPANFLGALFILTGLVSLGAANRMRNPDDSRDDVPALRWFIIALLAFAMIGTSQTLVTVPSRYIARETDTGLRVPLLMSGSLIGYLAMSRAGNKSFLKNFSIEIFILAGITLASHSLMFSAIDLFADANKAGLAHPIAVGTCIVSFCVYSLCWLKEELNTARLAGLTLATAGIIMVSW